METLHEKEVRLKQSLMFKQLYEENLSEELFESHKELVDKDIIMYTCILEDCNVSPLNLQFDIEDGEALPETSVERVAKCIKDGRCSHTLEESKVLVCRLVHYAAIDDRYLPSLKYLYEQHGCDVNMEISKPENDTPLCIAVHGNQIKTVKYLLSLEVDPNRGLHSPLSTSIQFGNVDIFNLLFHEKNINLNSKDAYGCPLLSYCVRNETQFVEPLLEAGACPDIATSSGVTPLMNAVTLGNEDLVKLLIKFGANVNQKNRSGETVILVTVYREELEMCRLLLEAGADPNFQTKNDGNSLLLLSSYDGCLEIIQLLMKFGGDAAQANNIGYTPLHIAAWNGHLGCVNEFIAAGVPHDEQTTDKNTPLALAAHGGHSAVMEVLLPLNCNVNNVDKDLDTAFHYASYNGLTRACELLLSHGADPGMCNRVNTTALWNAVYKSKKEVVKLLLLANVKLEVCSRGIDQHALTDDVVFIYEDPRSPLWVSVANNDPAIVLLLISAGYDLHREKWLIEGEYPGDCDPRIYSILNHHAHTPPRLVSRCRNFLRAYFGKGVMEKVKLLPIPETLKSYLTLSDLL